MATPFEDYLAKQREATAGVETPPVADPSVSVPEEAPTTEPLNPFEQFMSDKDVAFEPRKMAKPSQPAALAAPPELDDPGFVAGVVDSVSRSGIQQLMGGYHDWRQRANEASVVGDVERLQETQKGKVRYEDQGGVLGVSGSDITKFTKTLDPEGKEKILAAQMKGDVSRLQDHMDSAAEHEKKAGDRPFSPEVLEFMDENSELSIGEAFAKAPGKIIAELGIRSLPSSSEGIGMGMAGGLALSKTGPLGAAAGFGAGMALGSARVEYAASLVDVFKQNGADFQDAESIMKLVADPEFMKQAQDYAMARAAIIGGIDGLSGLIGAKHFTPGIKSTIARELANMGVQLPIQAAMGAGGEFAAQAATLEEGQTLSDINMRDVAAEAAGEGVQVFTDVPAAAITARRARLNQPGGLTPEQSPIAELEARQESAREEARAAGGDALDAEMAAAEVTSEITAAYTGQLEAARRFNEQTEAAAQEQVIAGEEQAVRDAAFDEAEAASEQLNMANTRRTRQADFDEAMAEQEEIRASEEDAIVTESRNQEGDKEIETAAAMAAAEEVQGEEEVATLGSENPELETLRAKLAGETTQKVGDITKKVGSDETIDETIPETEVTEVVEETTSELNDTETIPFSDVAEEDLTAGQKAAQRAAALIRLDNRKYKVVDIDRAAQEAATSVQNDLPQPTEAQKKAGNYKKGHVSVQGLDVSIENPTGSERTFMRDDGTTGSQTMQDNYGYIKRTVGADEDQVDVFIGDQPDSPNVFVIDQINQETGQFDEHKVMAGYPNQLAAVRAYKRNYEKGFKVGRVTPMEMTEFKSWLKDGSTTSPLQPIKTPQGSPQIATGEQIGEIQESQARRAPRRKVRYRGADGQVTTRPAPKKLTEKAATRAIEKIAKTTPGVGASVAVTSANLPSDLKAIVEADGKTDAKGFYDANRDTVYVFADNHTDEADVQRTVLHETVAHKGLNSLFANPEDFNNVMRDVYANANTTAMGKVADSYGLDVSDPESQLVAAEEYIAGIAESDIDVGVVQKVIDAVRAVLRKTGTVKAWSDNDIRALLRDARSSMRGKPLSEVIVIADAEVEETGEQIELEEPADVAIRQAQKRIGIVEQLRGCMG